MFFPQGLYLYKIDDLATASQVLHEFLRPKCLLFVCDTAEPKDFLVVSNMKSVRQS